MVPTPPTLHRLLRGSCLLSKSSFANAALYPLIQNSTFPSALALNPPSIPFSPSSSSGSSTLPLFFLDRKQVIFVPEALSFFTVFLFFPSTFFASRSLTLSFLHLSRSLDDLLCGMITFTPGLAVFFMMIRTLALVSSYLSDRAYPLTSSLSLLHPCSDYVEVNISLNDFSSLSFLYIYVPPIRSSLADSRITFFPSSVLSSFRNLFILKTSTVIFSFGTQEILQTLVGRNYLIGSSLCGHVTLTLLHFPSGNCSSSDIPFAPCFHALSCFWKVLQDSSTENSRFFQLLLFCLSAFLFQQPSSIFQFPEDL